MHLVSEAIDRYCLAHSTPPSDVCRAIHEYTLANVEHPMMVSGPLVGSFLSTMVRVTGAKRILEVGCFTGYSALVMAEALPQGGEVVTLNIDPKTAAIAQSFWDKSPHGKKIRCVIGPALDSMNKLKSPFDLVFIDADKENYLGYLKKALELTSINAVIIADNCLWSGRVVDKSVDNTTKAIQGFNDWVAAQPNLHSTLLPVRDGLMLVRKQGA